jgi:hypothetical protein
MRPVEDWDGAYRSYDLLKEIAIAFAVVVVLTIGLALAFGSSQREAVTFKEWATQDPVDFLSTTLAQLNGTSDIATYGPPYTDNPGSAQSLFGWFSPQRIAGVTIPIDFAKDLVLNPLGKFTAEGSALGLAIDEYRSATPDQRSQWGDAYEAAIDSAGTQAATIAPPAAGPLPTMLHTALALAQSGAVDAALFDDVPGHPGFFVMDYTRSQLYISDGEYLDDLGQADGLGGDQWGMAATLGNWPGQVWLLPVAFWYQFPPASTSDSGDLIVLTVVSLLAIVLVLIPFVPGLRALPKRLGVYRLIWRRHYRAVRVAASDDNQGAQ